ncbi:MAG: MBOAT family protein [Phormidesmis sp.]
MLFNSYVFIFIFLPVVLAGYYWLASYKRLDIAKLWLVVTSFVFYGYWNIYYVPLICFSIASNYWLGHRIAASQGRGGRAKVFLTAGVLINLAIICYYKYAHFFAATVSHLSSLEFTFSKVILPLAISFYTFTQIAYLVDAYKGETRHVNYSFLEYTLFVVFFPQLIAGPILRHNELIPQFRDPKRFLFRYKNFALGLLLFSLGLNKKVLIADNLSPWVSTVFSHADSVSFIEAWAGSLSYTFQLYFDFSGYSDMAIGLGLLFNIALPVNFDSPYKATGVGDFWRRWHITLSNFLRDYLYIPLGGSRRGELRRYTNLVVTMLLGGLWHGAGWTFILWGGLHGLYLSIDHGWRRLRMPIPTALAWLFTFSAVVFSWAIFRAETLADAGHLVKAMSGLGGIVLPGTAEGKLGFVTRFGIELQNWGKLTYLPEINGSKAQGLLVLAGLTGAAVLLPNAQEIVQKIRPNIWWALVIGSVTSFCLLSLNQVSEFLYFQF